MAELSSPVRDLRCHPQGTDPWIADLAQIVNVCSPIDDHIRRMQAERTDSARPAAGESAFVDRFGPWTNHTVHEIPASHQDLVHELLRRTSVSSTRPAWALRSPVDGEQSVVFDDDQLYEPFGPVPRHQWTSYRRQWVKARERYDEAVRFLRVEVWDSIGIDGDRGLAVGVNLLADGRRACGVGEDNSRNARRRRVQETDSRWSAPR